MAGLRICRRHSWAALPGGEPRRVGRAEPLGFDRGDLSVDDLLRLAGGQLITGPAELRRRGDE